MKKEKVCTSYSLTFTLYSIKCANNIHNNVENGQNTETSPGDLKRTAVTQTSVNENQPMLLWKTHKEWNNNNNNNEPKIK